MPASVVSEPAADVPAIAQSTARRHQAIFDSAVDFAIVSTDRAGRVTDWNSGAARIFGWSADEMRGQSAEIFFTPEDRAAGRLETEMRTSLEQGRASDERWHLKRDGSRFWASGEMMPLRDQDDAHLGFLKILRDMTSARQAAQELHEAQGLNALVLSSSRDCIVVLDLEARTQYVSPGGIESMEVADVQAILGLSWLRVWQGADLLAATQAVAEAKAGRSGRFQGFCATHRGTPKWWDVVISPLPGRDGLPERLVSVGRDITAHKQAEERLAQSDARQRTLTEMLPQLVWTCLPDGRCDYLSPQWVAYTGIDDVEQLGLDWLERVIHPDDRAPTHAHWMGAVAGRHAYDIEFRIRRHDGVYRWFKTRGTAIRDPGGEVRQWFGTCTDIQDIVEAREVLAFSQQNLERLVTERTRERDRAWKNSRDLQSVIDAHGLFHSANDAWTSILGWQPEEVVGRHVLDLVHPEDKLPTEGALTLASGDELPVFENRYRHRNGSWRWISWVAAQEDELIYASGRHITADKEAAAVHATTQEQLRQSQKMEAVGQLTGGLAHDFNNLLAVIINSLDVVKRLVGLGRASEADRYIHSSQGAAKRAAALIHRLLAFGRRQPLDPQPTDLNRLVTSMEELIRRTVGPAVHLEVVGAVGAWNVLVDTNQLENALLNLCINARDAMPDGGRLTIETANKWMDDRAARERDMAPGQYVSLEVTDTGSGMSPEVVERAFDPFFTTKPLGLGTGLGLSMVYGFARQSGGQARIYSEVGRGTTMRIYLPRHHGESRDEPAPAAVAVPRAEQGETALIVDDEPDLRMLLLEELQDMGYHVLEAADSAAGLKALQSDRRIDLLVTDVGLPGGLNGRQMADAGKALRPALKVLFITGYAENAVISNGVLAPDMKVLTKPFTMDDLAGRIHDLRGGT